MTSCQDKERDVIIGQEENHNNLGINTTRENYMDLLSPGLEAEMEKEDCLDIKKMMTIEVATGNPVTQDSTQGNTPGYVIEGKEVSVDISLDVENSTRLHDQDMPQSRGMNELHLIGISLRKLSVLFHQEWTSISSSRVK